VEKVIDLHAYLPDKGDVDCMVMLMLSLPL